MRFEAASLEAGVEDFGLADGITRAVEDAEDDEAVGADKSVLVVEDFRLDQLGDIALVLLESGPGGGLEDRAERLERDSCAISLSVLLALGGRSAHSLREGVDPSPLERQAQFKLLE